MTNNTLAQAKLELSMLKSRHLRALDSGAWDQYAALLTEDFALDISDRTGIPVMQGRDLIVNQISASIGAVTSVHQAHSPQFTVKSESEIEVVWAMQDRIARGDGQPSTSGYGHHHDRWVKLDGNWQLAEQRLTRLHIDMLPPAAITPTTAQPFQELATMSSVENIDTWMALSEAKAGYCRALDSKDWESFAGLMTEDFELDLSATSDLGVIKGREAALQIIRGSIETATTAHQVHMPEISLNGDEAHVIWPMHDRVVWGDDKPSLSGYGHYNERWVRRDGEWKLAWQKLTRLHIDMLPAAGND